MALDVLGSSELILASVVIATTIRGWFALRRHQIREQAENYRLTKALEDSEPQQRPAILRAYGSLARPIDDQRGQDPDNETR